MFFYLSLLYTFTDFSLHKSKSILFADFMKITIDYLPAMTGYLPANRCDSLMK